MKYGAILTPQTIRNKETYTIKFLKRKENSPYEYDDKLSKTFKCKIANNQEVRSYRLSLGVNANNESVYIMCSNLPENLKPQDKVLFMGQIKTIESIGYYFQDNGIINAQLFDDEYIKARSPKGITLI